MSAPPKPWERAGVNNQNMTTPLTGQMSSPTLPDTLMPDPNRGVALASTTRNPPPIPTRPSSQRPYSSGYSGMGGGYGGGMGGGYGMGGMGGYSSYGSSPYSSMYGGSSMYGSGLGGGYGGGYGMNRYGMNDNVNNTNSFARQAEDSSRQAFQSIESIVQAVGSVSMMLESSFYAVYNSFRAVVGVADHFSRMKMAFAQIFSAFAVIRTLRWLYRKLLVLLRLRPAGYDEELWAQAAEAGASALSEMEIKGQGQGPSRSSWPIMLFFAIIIGGPWLIWRLLSSIIGKKEGQEWTNGNDDHFRAVAEHEFQGDSEEELSFRRGQHITIAPKELQPRMRGWLLASVDGKKQGIIPANYVKILGKRRGRRHAVKLTVTPGAPVPGMPALPQPAGESGSGVSAFGSNLPLAPSAHGPPGGSSFADLEASFRKSQNTEHLDNSVSRGTNASSPQFELGENMEMPPVNTNNASVQIVDDPFCDSYPKQEVEEKIASDILEKSENIE